MAEQMAVTKCPDGRGFDVMSGNTVVASYTTFPAAQRHADHGDDQSKSEPRPEFWWMRD